MKYTSLIDNHKVEIIIIMYDRISTLYSVVQSQSPLMDRHDIVSNVFSGEAQPSSRYYRTYFSICCGELSSPYSYANGNVASELVYKSNINYAPNQGAYHA